MYRTDFWTLWEKARVGRSERIALKHVYYQVWNRLPVQVGCMRQVLRAGALGWPRGMGWGGRWERGPGWGTHVNPWLIHVNVWQKPLQYCKVISLQLIKINEKKKKLMVGRMRILNPHPPVSQLRQSGKNSGLSLKLTLNNFQLSQSWLKPSWKGLWCTVVHSVYCFLQSSINTENIQPEEHVELGTGVRLLL